VTSSDFDNYQIVTVMRILQVGPTSCTREPMDIKELSWIRRTRLKNDSRSPMCGRSHLQISSVFIQYELDLKIYDNPVPS